LHTSTLRQALQQHTQASLALSGKERPVSTTAVETLRKLPTRDECSKTQPLTPGDEGEVERKRDGREGEAHAVIEGTHPGLFWFVTLAVLGWLFLREEDNGHTSTSSKKGMVEVRASERGGHPSRPHTGSAKTASDAPWGGCRRLSLDSLTYRKSLSLPLCCSCCPCRGLSLSFTPRPL